jgi:hypothetical protein
MLFEPEWVKPESKLRYLSEADFLCKMLAERILGKSLQVSENPSGTQSYFDLKKGRFI